MLREYRRAGVPLVAFECADNADVCNTIGKELEANGKTPPIIKWDMVRGASGINKQGETVVNALCDGNDPAIATGNPVELLRLLFRAPDSTVIIMFGSQYILGEPAVKQAVWNLRDDFKSRGCTLVLLVNLGYKLPDGIEKDVVAATIPLPNEEAITTIVKDIHRDAKVELMEATFPKCVDALAGLSAFAAEQSLALSMSKEGVDIPQLWERKRKSVEQTQGLSVWRGGEKFSDIGGCENVKAFLKNLLKGKRAPRCIVFIDEIEKAMAGSGGKDSSGVSDSMQGTMLTWMQDKAVTGCIFIGPAGAAKSACSKATGNEAEIPTVQFDLSGMKGSLVGESEQRLRTAIATVDAIGQGRVLVLATCNSIGALSVELRRRFTLGTFFFDLPTAEEREKIWEIWKRKLDIKDKILPDDAGWTGAEIRQCCDVADRLGITLIAASSYVVPVSKSAPEAVENLRKQANQKFVSASHEGVYVYTKPEVTAGRKLEL